MAAGPEAAWKALRGVRRVQAEFRNLDRRIRQGNQGRNQLHDFIKELELVGDDVCRWLTGRVGVLSSH